ncbi:MAG: hypothetical protein BIFFINMI_03371 [Phycisphaerae bacterium]|nr:hypothetical protein [Phycisphaerae bacterium]
MRVLGLTVMAMLVALCVSGCKSSEKDQFVKDSNKTLDSAQSKIDEAKKSDNPIKKAAATAAESAVKTAREAVDKLKDLDDAKFQELKKDAEAKLKALQDAIKSL